MNFIALFGSRLACYRFVTVEGVAYREGYELSFGGGTCSKA